MRWSRLLVSESPASGSNLSASSHPCMAGPFPMLSRQAPENRTRGRGWSSESPTVHLFRNNAEQHAVRGHRPAPPQPCQVGIILLQQTLHDGAPLFGILHKLDVALNRDPLDRCASIARLGDHTDPWVTPQIPDLL